VNTDKKQRIHHHVNEQKAKKNFEKYFMFIFPMVLPVHGQLQVRLTKRTSQEQDIKN